MGSYVGIMERAWVSLLALNDFSQACLCWAQGSWSWIEGLDLRPRKMQPFFMHRDEPMIAIPFSENTQCNPAGWSPSFLPGLRKAQSLAFPRQPNTSFQTACHHRVGLDFGLQKNWL